MIYIWGTGNEGKIFYKNMKRYAADKTDFIFSSYVTEQMMKNDALNKAMVIIAEGASKRKDVYSQLVCMGISDNIFRMDEKEKIAEKMEEYVGKPVLPYIETHVNDHCNLNCKGCGHLSNAAPPNFADYETFERDITRLKELFSNICELRLMGGEPLLNPQLMDFVKFARLKNNDSDIRIVTNGLLICSLNEKVLKTLADLNIQLDITSYRPTIFKKGDIISVLKKYGVKYYFTDKVKDFMKFRNPCLNIRKEEAFRNCPIKSCTFLRKGKIAQCSFPILYSELDTVMKEKFKIDEVKDIIDIYDCGSKGWDIVWRLVNPIPACRYCRTNEVVFFPWESINKSKVCCDDWFVEE